MAIVPSGDTAMPSGSMPTSIWAMTCLVSVSTTVVIASSSLAIYRWRSLGCSTNCSGSSPEGRLCKTSPVAGSITCTVSLSDAQIYTRLKSWLKVIPRGRSPVGMVRVTASVATSITLIVLSFSLVIQISSAPAGAAQSARKRGSKQCFIGKPCMWFRARRGPMCPIPSVDAESRARGPGPPLHRR